MKNLQYFPFERNQYYYGKLITHQDLTSEQQYMNNKRRLINRFLHGTGVAAGLQVVRLDEQTISVEAGLALDSAGREIVVEEPTVFMLDQLEGYETLSAGEKTGEIAYICLAYGEEGINPARNAAAGKGAASAFEKCREGRKIYLTTVPREEDGDTVESLSVQTAVLYESRDLRVLLKLPCFVRGGDSLMAVIRLEVGKQLQEAAIRLEGNLSCLTSAGEERFLLEWAGMFREGGDAAEMSVPLTAFSVDNVFGEIHIRKGRLMVSANGQEHRNSADVGLKVAISGKDAYYQMVEYWYANQMNRVLSEPAPGGIYLAKLFLTASGDGFRIERIEQLPFGQRVCNSFVNMGLTDRLIREVEAIRTAEQEKKKPDSPAIPVGAGKTASGVVTIPLGIGGKSGEKYFSGEIVHGLGLGRVNVGLSIEPEEFQYFGSGEIFDDMKIRAELAAKANTERGSLVVGLRLLEATPLESVRIRWTVSLLPDEREAGSGRHIRILPDKPELKVMQTRYFRTETENLNGKTILWEVVTPDGGSISRDGRYTAPDTEGIYEIRAFCQEAPEINNSVFVIVRE